jgi:cytosine/uracil/thiamine/allantoin permease
VPAVLIGTLGVVAATAIDMTDPQLTIGEIVPAWFTPIFLAIVVLGSITNNVLVRTPPASTRRASDSGCSRAATVVITGVVATALAGWFVYIAPSFLDTLNASLELSVTVLGPLVAVYAVDILLRRNRYDGVALSDERRTSPFWYSGGWFWPGTIAMVVATTIAVLMANTTLYVGPIATALGGADLSAFAGPILRRRHLRGALADDLALPRPRSAPRHRRPRLPADRADPQTKMRHDGCRGTRDPTTEVPA